MPVTGFGDSHGPSVVADLLVRSSIFCCGCMLAFVVFDLVFQY